MRSAIAGLYFFLAPVWAQGDSNDSESIEDFDAVPSLSEWRQMADQGHAVAQYNLGVLYEYGRGVGQSDVEAAKWYERASRQGISAAQYKLGVMYDNGWGVPRDDGEAVKWYSEAAEQGHPFAQHDLAFMYVAGTGVGQDYVRAYMWLSIAVASGNTLMVKHLDNISGELSVAQIEEAESMAREWMDNHP